MRRYKIRRRKRPAQGSVVVQLFTSFYYAHVAKDGLGIEQAAERACRIFDHDFPERHRLAVFNHYDEASQTYVTAIVYPETTDRRK